MCVCVDVSVDADVVVIRSGVVGVDDDDVVDVIVDIV